MKCRAKMIDGSPVTFEWIDQGKMLNMVPTLGGYERPMGVVHVTQMSGEGFFVQSVVPAYDNAAWRKHRDRVALEQSGVDTATVEYWGYAAGCIRTSIPNSRGESSYGLMGDWRPLFPPTLQSETSMPIPGAITYLSSNPEMPPRADEGIIAAMVDACAVHIPDPGPVMQNIYNAIRRHLRDSKFKPQPTFEESRERITEWNRAHGAEPTHAMIDEGVRAVFVTSFRTGHTTAGELAAACWRAMEKART